MVLLLGATLALPGRLSAQAEERGRGLVTREVIQDHRRAITVYEVIPTGSAVPVVPRTITVIRHGNLPADNPDQDAIQRHCQHLEETEDRPIEPCVREQTTAHQQIADISTSTESDAGLTNIMQTCLARWQLDDGYDWQAAKQCYDRQRAVFARLYGR
jgi:hypothetical protein